jgi:type I restriction enzyme, S subunit
MANDWRAVSLGELFRVKHGFAFKSEYFTDKPQDTVLVTPGNFAIGGGFQDGKRKYYNGWLPEDYVLKPGQVVVTMTDLSKESDTLGYAASIPNDSTIWLHNQRVGLLEFKTEIPTTPRFIEYLLRAHEYRSWIVGSATGTTVKHTAPGRIESFATRIPPIEEQRAIAHILGTLDDKIELNRKQNETLEAMARTLFKAWFVDFEPVRAKIEGRWQRGQSLPGLPAHLYDLFPERLVESELGEIPEGWRVGPLQELLVLQRGFDLPTQSRIEGQFPVIAAGGINGTHHEAMVKGPGVVTGRSGVLGNVFLELGDYWPLNTTLWVKEFLAAKPCYAYELLSCIDFKMFNAGSAVPTLNRNHIHVVPQIIPSSEVIGKFEDMAMVLHQGIVANNRQSRSLAQLRDTLLPKLISGELRVPEAERFVGLAAA